MDNVFLKSVQSFITRFPDGGTPCSFFVTGGGFSLLDIGKVPGASKVLADAYIAYHMLEEIAVLNTVVAEHTHNLTNGNIGFVSPWPTYWYARAMMARHAATIPDATICVVNASLTTNWWRRGKNEAFFAVTNRPVDNKDGEIRMFRLDLDKLEEDEYARIEHQHEIALSGLSDMSQAPLHPITQRRAFEDEKVAQVAMGLLLEDPTLVRLIEHSEAVYPIEIEGDPTNPESFVPQLDAPWTARP